MDFGGIVSLIAVIVMIVLLLPLIVGGIFVVVVVANRAEPDLSGRRPAVVYAFAITFLTLFTTLFATTAMVASLCRLIGSHAGAQSFTDSGGFFDQAASYGGHQHPLGDSVARGAVLSGLVALVAGVVCLVHLRAAARASADVPVVDPLARVRSSYVAAVSFASVSIVIGASVVVLYDIFRGSAPGVFTESGTGGSVEVLRSMIPALYLALAALAILLAHLRHAPPPFQPGILSRWFGGPSSSTAVAPAPLTAPPAPVASDTVESETPRPAPRRRAPRKTTGPE